jgi:hypothetical protein
VMGAGGARGGKVEVVEGSASVSDLESFLGMVVVAIVRRMRRMKRMRGT